MFRISRVFCTALISLCGFHTQLSAEPQEGVGKISEKIENAKKYPKGFKMGAFALSMYYQGVSPSILDDLEKLVQHHHVGFDVPCDDDLKLDIKVRDAKKAFEFASKYYDAKETMTYEMANMANIFLQGIGTERNVLKTLEILRTYIPGDFRSFPPSYYEFDSFCFATPLVAYLYHHGIGVKKDFTKRDAVLDEFALELAWKNFYCGYLVPKDYELAIHCLKRRKDFWAAEELVKIYSGEYLPEHADKKNADKWIPVAKKRREDFIKKEQELIGEKIRKYEADDLGKSDGQLFRYYGTKIFILTRPYVFENLEIPNKYYNKEKALFYFGRYENRLRDDPYFSGTLKNMRENEFSTYSDGKLLRADKDVQEFLFAKERYYKKKADDLTDDATKQTPEQ